MSIIGSNILAGASGQAGYNLNNSLRFRTSASASLSRTPAGAGSRTTWTMSFWVKFGYVAGNTGVIFSAPATNNPRMQFTYAVDTGAIGWYQSDSGTNTVYYLIPTQVFRDYSSWYHMVVVADTTQATAANRLKMYVNGTQITSFSTATYPAQNTNTEWNAAAAQQIGRQTGASNYFDGYLTEYNFIDGQALTPASFGETSLTTGSWIPKKYTSTYGTNGFYLKFADASAATAAAIGKDSSGNGNNWTPSGISVTAGVTYDAMTDSPTLTSATVANYATLNPVYKAASQPTFSNANLTVAGNTNNYQNSYSTIAVTSGKWYAEIVVTGTPNSANMIGVSNQIQLNYLCSNADILGTGSGGTGYGYYIHDGRKYTATTASAYGNSIASGDIVGIALDLDNGKIWFSKNGTWQASGDPAAGTNAAFTGIASDTWSIGSTSYSTGATSFSHNFGQRPFTYTPPSGFVALNTYNLPTPTILQGNKYMDATTYTGNGSTQSITNTAGFKPDLVWIKSRNFASSHALADSVRGVSLLLNSNSTNAESTQTNSVTSLNANGFSLGADSSTWVNYNTSTLVGWQWQAGQGTTSSNTSGTITSTTSVNATAGFSIVTYTGNGTAGATVGHGLGVAPKMIINKSRATSATDWGVYHASNGNTGAVFLNSSNAFITNSGYWNNTSPTSSVFTLGLAANFNQSGQTYVAYCWAEIAGFSKFGSYTGNGSNDGVFVYCGFRPKFIMMKSSSSVSSWAIVDTSRDTYNLAGQGLDANTSAAEFTPASSGYPLDILSNGFKLRYSGQPNTAQTYIFMAFAENPFKNANAR